MFPDPVVPVKTPRSALGPQFGLATFGLGNLWVGNL